MSRSRRALFSLLVPPMLGVLQAHASSTLMFLETQAVAGFQNPDGFIYYSLHPEDVMQKPSVGLDYIQRLTTATADQGLLAVQARLAHTPDLEYALQPQLYNAYVKMKTRLGDIWFGHNRPAIGLSSYFDSHGLLLPTLAMYGFGADRDWGLGGFIPRSDGDLAWSITLGSGMPWIWSGNYQVSMRASWGVLQESNSTLGLSASHGRILNTMGYELMREDPYEQNLIGADAAWLWDNMDLRLEGFVGSEQASLLWAAFARLGIALADEDRVRLETQVSAIERAEEVWPEWAAGATWKTTPELTLRAMWLNRPHDQEQVLVGQAYYYFQVL